MNLGHQVETAEMSDADLDQISGGLAVGGSGGLFVETPVVDICADATGVGTENGLALGTSLHAASH
ncbi:hypothetical protein AB0M97_23630 [Streptomyces sp. NPDC051207]|uniref:hypothetical protein n=1 Tax=Streptomyces sp. NPDC051207 TaxID=3154641 RepID=UPI0034136FF1